MISRYTCFLGYDGFSPKEDSTAYRLWKTKNICMFKDVCFHSRVLDKTELEDKLQTSVPWFLYHQLCHLCTKVQIQKILKLPLTDFELIVKKVADNQKGLISTLQSIGGSFRTQTDEVPEGMGEIQISDQEWMQIWQQGEYASKIVTIKRQTFTILSLWYTTPVFLIQCWQQVQPPCWKGCGNQGSFTHCQLECDKIKQFRKSVTRHISAVVDCDLEPSLDNHLS